MSLEYILPPSHWFFATITQYPNNQYLKDFVELLHADEQSSLMCSNFYGFIYGVIHRGEEEQQFSSKLIHEFIMRFVNSGKNNEVWVKLDNYLARFGMQEFCLITSLPCHEISINLNFNNDRLRNQYFNGTKKISMKMLLETFRLCEHQQDKFKLGLVMLVECILKPTTRYIDYRTLGMVEQLEDFLQYPWGRKAYFTLLNSLQHSQLERLQRMQQNNQNECKYTLHGYPLAFQYWIYETFPQIGRKFGRRKHKTKQGPRMHRWKPNKILSDQVVKQFLTTQEIQVLPILQPTEEELETLWYRTLSLPQDNYHNILDRIVNGELNNITQEVPEDEDDTNNMLTHPDVSRTHISVETSPIQVGPSSTSIHSNYVTREEMKEMMKIYKEDIVSDISRKQDSHYEAILQHQKESFEQQHKWQQDHYQHIQSTIQNQYQIILENQKHFFEQQQQWQEDHYQNMQSSMQNYVDTNLTSVISYINEENTNMLKKMSDWESNMESAIFSFQQDIPLQSEFQPEPVSTSQRLQRVENLTQISTQGKKGKRKKISTRCHLEDYLMKRRQSENG